MYHKNGLLFLVDETILCIFVCFHTAIYVKASLLISYFYKTTSVHMPSTFKQVFREANISVV